MQLLKEWQTFKISEGGLNSNSVEGKSLRHVIVLNAVLNTGSQRPGWNGTIFNSNTSHKFTVYNYSSLIKPHMHLIFLAVQKREAKSHSSIFQFKRDSTGPSIPRSHTFSTLGWSTDYVPPWLPCLFSRWEIKPHNSHWTHLCPVCQFQRSQIESWARISRPSAHCDNPPNRKLFLGVHKERQMLTNPGSQVWGRFPND